MAISIIFLPFISFLFCFLFGKQFKFRIFQITSTSLLFCRAQPSPNCNRLCPRRQNRNGLFHQWGWNRHRPLSGRFRLRRVFRISGTRRIQRPGRQSPGNQQQPKFPDSKESHLRLSRFSNRRQKSPGLHSRLQQQLGEQFEAMSKARGPLRRENHVYDLAS